MIECERSKMKCMSVKENLLTIFGTAFSDALWLMWWCVLMVIVQMRITVNALFVECTWFLERERECPTYLVLKPDSGQCVICTTWKCESGCLAVWSEPGKLPAALVGTTVPLFFFLHWQGFCRVIHWLSLTVHICGCALRGSTPVGTRDKKCCRKNQALY